MPRQGAPPSGIPPESPLPAWARVTFHKSDWRCLSKGALCAGLANRAADCGFAPEL